MNYKIYIDLDGVLTDFDKQLSKILNIPLKRNSYPPDDPEIWKKINKTGPLFWSSMDWMPDGKKLWNHIKKYNPIILSSPSSHPSSIEGKKLWIEENLPNVPYILENKKEIYAKENHILIDNSKENINKWKENNGIGILHKNSNSTIQKLEEILENIKQPEKINKLKESSLTLLKLSEKLNKLNNYPLALSLLKIAQQIKEIYKEKETKQKTKGKFLWYSGDERLEIIKEVLNNIIRRLTPINIPSSKIPEVEEILKNIKKMSITPYPDPSIAEKEKKEILSKAFNINTDLAELLGLLFKQPENIKDLDYIISQLKRKATPFLPKSKKKEFKEEEYYVSPIFREMLKRKMASINLSHLPPNLANTISYYLNKIKEL